MSLDFESIVLEQLKELKNKQGLTQGTIEHLDKKIDLHILKSEYELQRLHSLDEQQNKILDQHIEGVKSVKELVVLHRSEYLDKIERTKERIQKLEQPVHAMRWLKRNLIWVATVSGLLASLISKVTGLW